MPVHKIYRNGRLYDQLDPQAYATIQIAHGYAHTDPGNEYTVKDESGEIIYQCKVTITPPSEGGAGN